MGGELRKPGGGGGSESPFHPGEQAVQSRLQVRERVEQMGRRMIRDFMTDEHRQFFEDLPFVLVGSQSEQGDIWASIVLGEPGFVRAPGPRRLEVRAPLLPGEPASSELCVNAPLGLLGIELSTRRRNRVNGRVADADAGGFAVNVEQTFGNCKQYIQSRAGDHAAFTRRRGAIGHGAERARANGHGLHCHRLT
jgi:uncharacterized protein